MSELKDMGTSQNVKVYKRHGAGDNLFGVSFANLGKLKKAIKVDHELAGELWHTGNTDARCLATMIIDSKKFSSSQADKWIDDVEYYLLADLLAQVIAQTDFALKKMDDWMKSKDEFKKQCGYAILSCCLKDGVEIPDSKCKKILKTIEKEIHASPNRAKHSMNMALISIGIYKASLTDSTMEFAEQIGKVKVDHGETGCKTPDAIPYILKSIKRHSTKRKN